MKKLIFTLFLFFLSASFIYSQQYEDVVYLKNGSIIHGTIIEQVPNESIKIKTKDGNVFVYSTEEISKITREETIKKQKLSYDNKLWLGFITGLNLANISISSPSQTLAGPDGIMTFMLGIIAERNFNKNFSLQTGLTYIKKGADKIYILGYYPCSARADYLDLDVLMKAKLNSKGFTPYGLFGTFVGFKLSAEAKHQNTTIDWSSYTSGINLGLYFGAGIDLNTGKNSAVLIEFRYELGANNVNDGAGTSMVTTNGIKMIAGMKFGL